MLPLMPIGLPVQDDEMKGFSRTIAEIEWLLLILVLVYLVAGSPPLGGNVAIQAALFFFGAFILGLHYVHFYKQETLVKLAAESWMMVGFVTWVVWFSGRLQSPLLYFYLLPVVASALILGKTVTLLQMACIALCFVFLGWQSNGFPPLSLAWGGQLLAQFAPLILIAYVTTMLSADIRYAVGKIKRVSDLDELTGLYNMRAFNPIANRVFRQTHRYSHPMSIVMIDSDNLKLVNDAAGHEAGNQLLQHIVARIREGVRSSDVVARYGGDEFIVLLPETGPAGAMEVAERIRVAVQTSNLVLNGQLFRTTVSAGVVTYPTVGGDLASLMDKADKALYQAKNRGRNRVVAYTDSQRSLPFEEERVVG
jgi:diguanylate cyclase (GGDEF)-like protein